MDPVECLTKHDRKLATPITILMKCAEPIEPVQFVIHDQTGILWIPQEIAINIMTQSLGKVPQATICITLYKTLRLKKHNTIMTAYE